MRFNNLSFFPTHWSRRRLTQFLSLISIVPSLLKRDGCIGASSCFSTATELTSHCLDAASNPRNKTSESFLILSVFMDVKGLVHVGKCWCLWSSINIIETMFLSTRRRFSTKAVLILCATWRICNFLRCDHSVGDVDKSIRYTIKVRRILCIGYVIVILVLTCSAWLVNPIIPPWRFPTRYILCSRAWSLANALKRLGDIRTKIHHLKDIVLVGSPLCVSCHLDIQPENGHSSRGQQLNTREWSHRLQLAYFKQAAPFSSQKSQ